MSIITLTKLPTSHSSSDVQAEACAGAPVVTVEMIEAGIDAYRSCDREFDSDEMVVSQVFFAMAEAARSSKNAGVSSRQSEPPSQWWLT